MGEPPVPGEQPAFRGLFRFGVIGPESAAACQEGAGDSTSGKRFPETRRGFVTVTDLGAVSSRRPLRDRPPNRRDASVGPGAIRPHERRQREWDRGRGFRV